MNLHPSQKRQDIVIVPYIFILVGNAKNIYVVVNLRNNKKLENISITFH